MINKILGLLILAAALLVVYLFESSAAAAGPFRIFHWPALVLTGIGPFGVVMLCSDRKLIQDTIELLIGPSATSWQRRSMLEAQVLRRLSQDFYLHGSKSLDQVDRKGLSPYVSRMLDRLSVRMPVQDVRDLLERERALAEAKLDQATALLGLGVRLTPSIGMLGTILGMTHLLANLKDPANIGSHMSLALLTTFYGLFFSLVFWTPLQNHLNRVTEAQLHGYDQALHWLELVEQRKPAQYFASETDAHEPALEAPIRNGAGAPKTVGLQ